MRGREGGRVRGREGEREGGRERGSIYCLFVSRVSQTSQDHKHQGTGTSAAHMSNTREGEEGVKCGWREAQL